MVNYRLRITFPGSGATARNYITRTSGRIDYFSSGETPLALSNLLQDDAAEVRFKLEDAENGEAACALLQAALKRRWVNNPGMCPKVERIAP